jgi:lipopolysaccharide export system protein LptA
MGQDGPPSAAGAEIQSATVDGHVVLVQQPAARRDPASKPGVPAEAPLRATAGRAVFEAAGEWLHLTIEPRVENGGLQLTANRLDISQASGDAFARGNVKATWAGNPGGKPTREENSTAGAESGAMALGGQGPAHVVAAEAQLHPATGEATFRGHARLWQQSNSISAPVIVLNRLRQTLVAHSSSAADPVRVIMLSADKDQKTGIREKGLGNRDQGTGIREQGTGPSVIRVRGGDLKYSEAERKAVMHADPGGSVVAETGSATVAANDLELVLLAPGNHAGPEGEPAQVDQVTASGHVRVNAQGRRGAGERLVYSSETGEYVLTGTAANPPTLTDPAKGTVSGASLIFNSRDDSVSIEGGGRKTLTETVAPK